MNLFPGEQNHPVLILLNPKAWLEWTLEYQAIKTAA